MKKSFVFLLAFFLVSCENNRTASSGESMWVVLNHVKPDKRQQFEKFAYDILLPALKATAKNDIISRKIIDQTRMLEPMRVNKDSSYTYIWLMDPLVKDASYSYPNILSQVYTPEEVKEYISMNDECLAEPQVSYRVKQGSWQ